VAHLPPDSATASALDPTSKGWTTTDYLVADLFQAFTGQVHPHRPTPDAKPRVSADTVRRLQEQRERLRKQEPHE
jgi:hypothetical protein